MHIDCICTANTLILILYTCIISWYDLCGTKIYGRCFSSNRNTILRMRWLHICCGVLFCCRHFVAEQKASLKNTNYVMWYVRKYCSLILDILSQHFFLLLLWRHFQSVCTSPNCTISTLFALLKYTICTIYNIEIHYLHCFHYWNTLFTLFTLLIYTIDTI